MNYRPCLWRVMATVPVQLNLLIATINSTHTHSSTSSTTCACTVSRVWTGRVYSCTRFFLLSPLGKSATNWPIVPAPGDDECGAVGGIITGRENWSTRGKPAPVPLCPPQIPHDLGSNPGRRGGKPTTNRLSYGTAFRALNCNPLYEAQCDYEHRSKVSRYRRIIIITVIINPKYEM
jgi:hypothetical protein